MGTTERTDIFQSVTDRIIAAIEAGAGDWKMPWHAQDGGTMAMPINAVSRRPYRGINPLLLWAAAQAAGYQSGIVFWKVFDEGETEAAPD